MVRDDSVLPDFEPRELTFPTLPAFQYAGDLQQELAGGRLTPADALDMLESMMSIRAFEEMIVALRMQSFAPLRRLGFQYRGPTHLSVGQEAAREIEAQLRGLILDRFDPDAIELDVRESIARRRLIQQAMMTNGTQWPAEPNLRPGNCLEQYV